MPTILLRALLICCSFFCASQKLFAVTFSPDDVIYQQDYNNDGLMDYIVTPPVRWVPIDVDGITSIVPTAQAYSVLLKQADGSYTIQQLENFMMLPDGVTPLTNLSRTYKDFNGDGINDFFLRTATATGVISYTSSGVSNSSKINLSNFIGNGVIVMSVTDANGDGITDIMISEDGVIKAVAYGNRNGGVNNILNQLNYVLPSNNPSNMVVNLAGQLDVNDMGAANYSLPIDVPPGINGLQPAISVSYSSMSGNGPMGIGWNLAAGGSITRCGKTKEQDNLHDGVDFDADDQFCLDGQRLRMMNSGTPYAQGGQPMRTEMETFQRIVPSGNYNGDPDKFTVTHTDGSVKIYGGDNSRRILNTNGRVASYLLAQVSDVNNNSVQYLYNTIATGATENIPVLTQITYNGYNVQINYDAQNRNDIVRGYLAPSTSYAYLKRINNIEVSYQGRALYNYRFSYESVDATLQLSRLTNIQRCLPSLSKCTAPLQFSYEKESGVMGGFNNAYNATPQTDTANQFDINDTHNYKSGDFNADGKTDFVHLASPSVMKLWLSNGDGTFTIKTINAPAGDANLKAPDFHNPELGSHITYPFYPGDFDGDGDTDLVHLVGDNTMITWLSNGDGNFTLKNTTSSRWVNPAGTDENTGYYNYRVGEFNGDGIADLLNFYTSGSVRVLFGKGDGTFEQHIAPASSGYNAAANGYRFDQGDFNGDGLTDLVHFASDAVVHIWLAKGDGNFDIQPGFRPWSTYSISANNYRFVIGDYNGDGKSDMVHLINGNTFHTWYSRGDGTFGSHDGAVAVNTNNTGGYNLSSANYHFIPADVNGDGLTDLIHQVDGNGDYLHVWLAKHDGTFVAPTFSTPTNADANKPAQFQVGDFNGDGKSDFVFLFSDSTYQRSVTIGTGIYKKTTIYRAIGIKSFLSKSPQYHRLNAVKDAFGNESTISYQRLLSSPRYKKIPDGESSAYPSIFVSLPLQVVSQVANIKPRADMTTTDYEYTGLKLQQRGLGLLGFNRITTLTRTRQPYSQPKAIDDGNQRIYNENEQSAIITRTRYSQVWQTRAQGMVEDAQTYRKDVNAVSTFCITGDGCTGLIGAQLLSNVDNVITALYPGNSTRFYNYLSKTITNQYAFNSARASIWMSTSTTNNNLDTWGNLIHTDTNITDRQNNLNYSAIVDNSYYPANESNWQINLLSRQVQTRTTPDLVPLQPATETRTTAFEYDGLGRLLRKIIEPDNPSFKSEETNTYNLQGLLTRTQVTAGGQILRTNSSTYNANGSVSSRSNAFGHRESYQYTSVNFPWLTSSVTGPNGLTTLTDYDELGRANKQTGADNVVSTSAWYSCTAPHANFPCSSDANQDPEFYYSLQQTLGQQPTLTYFDRLGRTVRTQRYQVVNGTDQIATQFTRYNAEGLAYLNSKPFFAGDSILYQTTDYDTLNRATQITDFNGAITRSSYEGFKTIATDALGRNFTTMSNALGQTLWTMDTNNQRIAFIYDAFGNLAQTTDAASNKIQNQYDILGRKIQMRDPDQGTWNYQYDVLGQLIKQTDAMGQQTTMNYDVIGRMSTRTDSAQTTQWIYDQGTQGIGKLSSQAIGPVNQAPTISNQYQYDTLGRSKSVTTTIVGGVGAGTYTSSTTYDSFSRPQTQSYPTNGLTLRNEYSTSSGQLVATKDATSGQVLWQLGSQNASGQLTSAALGGNIYRQFDYDNNNRLVQSQASVGATLRQQWQVQYDAAGNVVQRKDAVAGLNENMAYDNINRLTNTYGGSVTTNGVSYDALGNILIKQDVGSYIYGQTCNGVKAGPHAVTQTTGGAYSAGYCYDRNGNLTNKTQANGFNQQVVYTPFNKPAQILQSDGNGTLLEYGPSRELIRQTDSKAGVVTYSLYLPGYERVQSGTTVVEKFYIGDYAVYSKSGGAWQLRYLLQDNQGSITTILDPTGAVAEKMAFDVWGKRRNTNWSPSSTPATLASTTTNRGYTGHKMLDNVGLIHMNGRVYDPVIARFVSADPIIQSPNDLQAYNRYAYVRNNPGSLTDPSGYSWFSDKWKQIRRVAIAAVAVTICVSSAGAGCGLSAQMMVFSATMAARRTLDHGGTMRQAMSAAAFSAATSAVFYGVGQAYGVVSEGMTATSAFATKVAMHGVAGCGVSAAGGGSCADGAVSSGIAAGYSFLSDANGAGFTNNDLGSIVEAGVVGGGSRQLMGGSFSEGFEAGAAGQAYNALQLIPLAIVAGRAMIAAAPRVAAAYRGWRAARNALNSDVANTTGKTVLGHFPEYKNLAESMGARRFNIPESVWNKMSEAERWGANQKFLDRMISRGDDVILSTPLDKVRPGSYFAKELEYLGGKGYRPSADGSRLMSGD